MPYAKATIGPVALEAEINYTWGDAVKAENELFGVEPENRLFERLFKCRCEIRYCQSWRYLRVRQGDDNMYDDVKHNASTGGIDYNPCLLMFNYDTVNYWIGGVSGWAGMSAVR